MTEGPTYLLNEMQHLYKEVRIMRTLMTEFITFTAAYTPDRAIEACDGLFNRIDWKTAGIEKDEALTWWNLNMMSKIRSRI